MAIRIRCSECNKKISIDEAFAGGMCRCPYCKALAYVPEGPGKAGAASRPTAPGGRPGAPQSRPEAPGAAAAAAAEAAAEAGQQPALAEEHIPMARPVKIQGIITIVLLGLLLVMVGAGIALTLIYIKGPNDRRLPPPEPPRVDPLNIVQGGPGVAGMKLQAGPVLYVLDGGSSMRGAFDYGRVIIGNSVGSLGEKGQFTILLCREDGDRFLGDGYQPGGGKGKEAAEDFLAMIAPMGATDVSRALKAALERKPKEIVLIARKVVDDAMDLAHQAAQQGVAVHSVILNGDPEVTQSMEALAKAANGQSQRVFTPDF